MLGTQVPMKWAQIVPAATSLGLELFEPKKFKDIIEDFPIIMTSSATTRIAFDIVSWLSGFAGGSRS